MADARSARATPRAAAPREQREGERPEGRDDLVGGRTQSAYAVADLDVHRYESANRHRIGAGAERHFTASDAAERRARRAHERGRVQQRRESNKTATAPKDAAIPPAAARRERAPPPTTTRTALRARAAAA